MGLPMNLPGNGADWMVDECVRCGCAVWAAQLDDDGVCQECRDEDED